MSQLKHLKSAMTLRQVAPLLNFKASALSYVLYQMPDALKYEYFEIPKKTGGTRGIRAPSPELKTLQRHLSDLLQNCMEEINEIEKRRNKFSNGFARGRSIVLNAKEHRQRRFVFNIDLSDFFGSINFGRVRGFFIKDQSFLLHPKVATILAQIACFNNALPQGSPCSPVISNLIGHVLDVHLVRLAHRNGCTYSRYADDITFSTNEREFPTAIAIASAAGHVWDVGSELAHLIKLSGFTINSAKTRMQYRDSRQEVTGLVVNKKVNVRTEYRRTVRAMVHRLFTTGHFELLQLKDGGAGKKVLGKTDGKLDQLHGMLGFIDSIDLFNRRLQNKPLHSDELTTKESMFRSFLFYREFYVSPMPVILCEGKTDNVYLKHAIHALAAGHPVLAAMDAAGNVQRKVRIYRYADTSTGRILGINGGTAQLATFMRRYAEAVARFKAPGALQPLILVLDNDSGAKGKGKIFNTVKDICKIVMTGAEDFVHVTGNMYVTLTPLVPGKTDSMMEDFFDSKTKGTLIDGKGFDPNSNMNTATHYGKHVFAQKVVAVDANSIDFSGFNGILSNVSSIVAAHVKP